MAPPRAPDPGIYARVARLEQRMARLESGGLLRRTSVFPTTQQFFGAWPQSMDFHQNNDLSNLVIIYSGSAYVTATGVQINLLLIVDGVGYDSTYLNPGIPLNQHMALPVGIAWFSGLESGWHTATLTLTSGTSDQNDGGHIVALEMP